jgi:hypothetical protein
MTVLPERQLCLDLLQEAVEAGAMLYRFRNNVLSGAARGESAQASAGLNTELKYAVNRRPYRLRTESTV